MYEKKLDSIDKILLDKGLLTHQQLTVALQYQCRLPKGSQMSLAEVLVALEFVTSEQIQGAIGQEHPEEDVLVQVLVREGTIQEEQLSDALKVRDNSTQEKRLGTVLMELGHASKEVIQEALKHYYLFYQSRNPKPIASVPQEEPPKAKVPPPVPKEKPPLSPDKPQSKDPIGQKLLKKGYISPAELQDAIDYQFRLPRILHKPLGEILIYLGYISESQLHEVTKDDPGPSKDAIGQILIRKGVIQEWQLSHVMTLQYLADHQHKKLGSLLVEMGYAQRPQIEAALKDYFAAEKAKKADQENT